MHKNISLLLAATGLLAGGLTIAPRAIAQRVVDVTPAPQNRQVDPAASISGVFNTTGAPGIEADSVRVFVNGQDVTRQSTITPNFFSYRPSQPLTAGETEVRVEFTNTRGLRQVATWSFTVQRPQPVAEITSVTHNATEPLGAGATFLATINGTPGADATVLLIDDNGTVRELDAQEVSSGVYVASLAVQSRDRIQTGAVVGRLERQGQTIFAAAEQPVALTPSASASEDVTTTTISGDEDETTETTDTETDPTTTALAELKPEFTNYSDGDLISGSGFTLVGQTRPNATVDIEVTSRLASLGGLINIGTQTLVDRQVTADENGQFEVEVSSPTIAASGTRYTVRATARDSGESSTTQISLTQD